MASISRLYRALTMAVHFSSIPQQTKMELYTDLNKYASDVVLTHIKLEERITALENELKMVKTKVNNGFYKQYISNI